MTNGGQDKVIAFDTLFTTNHIQMLKVLLTYMPHPQQRTLAVYIKFLELQYTLSFFQNHPSCALPYLHSEEILNSSKLCDELLPLCNHEEQERLKQIKNMYQNFENMQEMIKMADMIKDMFPEGDIPFGGDPSALFSGLSGASGIDMSQMFEMFQSMNDN